MDKSSNISFVDIVPIFDSTSGMYIIKVNMEGVKEIEKGLNTLNRNRANARSNTTKKTSKVRQFTHYRIVGHKEQYS